MSCPGVLQALLQARDSQAPARGLIMHTCHADVLRHRRCRPQSSEIRHSSPRTLQS